MDTHLLKNYLIELSEKYSISEITDVAFDQGKIIVECKDRVFRFVYDFLNLHADDIPLFYWRNDRKFVELKKILRNRLISEPIGMRIHHIVPKSEFDSSLFNILFFESDLFEFITENKIERIFADYSGDFYTNCILSATNDIKASLELGFSPKGSEPVLLHEIIAKTGTASDVAVDTQMIQYPIYIINGEETKKIISTDNELFDLTPTQADCVRFILDVLNNVEKHTELKIQYRHLMNVYHAAEQSAKTLKYTNVEVAV